MISCGRGEVNANQQFKEEDMQTHRLEAMIRNAITISTNATSATSQHRQGEGVNQPVSPVTVGLIVGALIITAGLNRDFQIALETVSER